MRHSHNPRWTFAGGLLVLAALAALLAPAQAARADSPTQCNVTPFGQGPNTSLGANVFLNFGYDAPVGVSSVSGGAVVVTHPGWNVMLGNASSSAVTDATITISTGYDSSWFEFGQPPTPGLPSSCSVPTLASGSAAQLNLFAPGVNDSLRLGYDSSTAASPSVLPAGGGLATETFMVKVTDPQLAGGDIGISTGNGAVMVVSQSVPQNLDQGESVSADGNDWELSNAQLDKQYEFSAVVDVATPADAGPSVFSGQGSIGVTSSACGPPCGTVPTTSSSTSIPDAGLDGAFGFSTDQSGVWTVFHKTFYGTNYQGLSTFTADLCKNGGWKTYGLFKNQGDCVSFVVTGGKNPPAK